MEHLKVAEASMSDHGSPGGMTNESAALSSCLPAKLERGRTLEQEAEDQLAIMRRNVDAIAGGRPDRPALGEAAVARIKPGILRFAAVERTHSGPSPATW